MHTHDIFITVFGHHTLGWNVLILPLARQFDYKQHAAVGQSKRCCPLKNQFENMQDETDRQTDKTDTRLMLYCFPLDAAKVATIFQVNLV